MYQTVNILSDFDKYQIVNKFSSFDINQTISYSSDSDIIFVTTNYKLNLQEVNDDSCKSWKSRNWTRSCLTSWQLWEMRRKI